MHCLFCKSLRILDIVFIHVLSTGKFRHFLVFRAKVLVQMNRTSENLSVFPQSSISVRFLSFETVANASTACRVTRSGYFSPENAANFGYFSANIKKFWAISAVVLKFRLFFCQHSNLAFLRNFLATF